MSKVTQSQITTFIELLANVNCTVDPTTFQDLVQNEPKSFVKQFEIFTPSQLEAILDRLVNENGYMVPQTCKVIKNHAYASIKRDSKTGVVTLTVDGCDIIIYNKEYRISKYDFKKLNFFQKLLKTIFG